MNGPAPARVVADAGVLARTVAGLAARIDAAHPEGVVLVGVLPSALVFVADLARALRVPVEVDFLAVSDYRAGAGRARILKDLDADVAGRVVVVCEAVVDTGLTAAYLGRALDARRPAAVEVCALFDRRARRIVPVPLAYVGFEAPDDVLVGYGLDVAGRYANLGFVAAGDGPGLAAHPELYLDTLYGSGR